MTKRIVVEQANQEFTFTFSSSPTNVELDPKYNIFRWLLEIRIFAHAHSAQLFLNLNRDLNNAEREAQYSEYKADAWATFYASSPVRTSAFLVAALRSLLTAPPLTARWAGREAPSARNG